MQQRRERRERPRVPASLTRALGVYGWSALDSVLLAALALEAPVLLVGRHGTAKSFLVERVSAALGCEFRHYNASLLNYDDLVGIPLPDESGERLRFLSTPASIWGAEFVFFDEISRCRADLQNKLFPIVHERRVGGIELERLRFRWAAMNPPAPEDPDDPFALGASYVGSEPLDPALADRFPFVLAVPGWGELSKSERLALVAASGAESEPPSLAELVDACRERAAAVEATDGRRVCEYVVSLVDQLAAAQIGVSPRRASMLARCVVYVHAADQALGVADDLEASAELALACTLPQAAEEAPPTPATLRGAHRQAWELSALAADDSRRLVLEEADPVERVLLGDRLGLADRELARLVTQALAAQESEARRLAVATALLLAFRERRELTPAAWEPVVQLARRVLEPRELTAALAPGRDLDAWREINALLADPEQPVSALERNFLYAGVPDLWRRCDWRTALRWLREELDRFGVRPEEWAA